MRGTFRANLNKHLKSVLQLGWEPYAVFAKKISQHQKGLRRARQMLEAEVSKPLKIVRKHLCVSLQVGPRGTGWKHESPSLASEHKKRRKFNETERQEVLRGKKKILFYAVYAEPVEAPNEATKARVSITQCMLCWIIKIARVLVIKGWGGDPLAWHLNQSPRISMKCIVSTRFFFSPISGVSYNTLSKSFLC